MLDVEKLRQEREKAFDVWFDRWWKREDVEQKIKISNYQGYTGYILVLDDYSKYEQSRMYKDRFLLKLQEMLPNFRVEYKCSKSILTKREYIHGITINWEISKSENL